MSDESWYGVRCVFGDIDAEPGAPRTYEERVTVWRASSAAEAIARAQQAAAVYAFEVGAAYLGLAQCYTLADDLGDGAEVFALLRESRLDAGAYLGEFFATGAERAADTAP